MSFDPRVPALYTNVAVCSSNCGFIDKNSKARDKAVKEMKSLLADKHRKWIHAADSKENAELLLEVTLAGKADSTEGRAELSRDFTEIVKGDRPWHVETVPVQVKQPTLTALMSIPGSTYTQEFKAENETNLTADVKVINALQKWVEDNRQQLTRTR